MTDPARVPVATDEQRKAGEYIIDMLAQLEDLARRHGLEGLAATIFRAIGQCEVGCEPEA